MTLYVSDLDGTLLDALARLPERSRLRLSTLIERGMHFTVASARHVVSIRKILAGLPLRLPVIGSNGACISDLHTGQHLMVHGLAPDWAREILACLRRHRLLPFVSVAEPGADRLYWEASHNPGQEAFVQERIQGRDPRLMRTAQLEAVLCHPCTALVVVDAPGPLRAAQADLQRLCGQQAQVHLAEDLYAPQWPWLTIQHPAATKDKAIARLIEWQGWSGRELVVFGDHLNDIGMMRSAHRAVAPSNAVDAIKAMAHEVIGHHAEGSVLDYLEARWKP